MLYEVITISKYPKFFERFILLVLILLLPILSSNKTQDPSLTLQFISLAIILFCSFILLKKEACINKKFILFSAFYLTFVLMSGFSFFYTNDIGKAIFISSKSLLLWFLFVSITFISNSFDLFV